MTDSQVKTALRLLEEQKDIPYIMQVTGLSETEIRKLQLSGNLNNTGSL